jgi:hypothetical protein
MMTGMMLLWALSQLTSTASLDVTSANIADAAPTITGQRAHMTHEIRRLSGGHVAELADVGR